MVPVRICLEISAPTVELMEALPPGAKLAVVFSPSQVYPVAIQVEIYSEPNQMQGIRNTLARLGIEDGHPLISGYFPDSDLIAEVEGAIH